MRMSRTDRPVRGHEPRGLAPLRAGACAVLATALVVGPASADDTEVFFGQVNNGEDINPNVLFVLDTSGSMNWMDTDYTGTRADRLKDAMRSILDESKNLNVGLMRLNGGESGGAVIYPVRPLDQEVCTHEDCHLIDITRRIDLGTDDVEEHLKNGRMEHGGQNQGRILSMGGNNSNSEQLVGYRFRDLRIPRGAKIKSATLRMTAFHDDSGSAKFRVRAQKADDAATFGTAPGDLSGRDFTNAKVNWTPGTWEAGKDYRTPDLSSIVQKVVNRAGWCGGNSMAFAVELKNDDDFGKRSAYSFDSGPGFAAALDVSYDASDIADGGGCNSHTAMAGISTGSDDALEFHSSGGMNRTSILRTPVTYYNGDRYDLTAGLRFHQVDVPPGAEIESAKIELRTLYRRTDTVTMDIRGDRSSSSRAISGYADDLERRPRTNASSSWSPGVAEPGDLVTTSDVSGIVSEIVGLDGWSANNAMTFLLEPSSGSGYRDFYAFDQDPNKAARLIVEYRAAEPGRKRTVRDELKNVVANMTSEGGTPIVDAYYEAASYLLGKPVDYGRSRGIDRSDQNSYDWRHQYHRVSHPDSYIGGSGVERADGCTDANLDSWQCRGERILGESPTYVSSFGASCQSNHVVFLSDGAAQSNTSADKVQTLIGSACEDEGLETCGRELASWLYRTDLDPELDRKQNVHTYTIGFNTAKGDATETLMKDLASEGGGRFFTADSSAELVGVFKDIIGDVETVDTTFVAPGATVNQFNRLTHRNDIYFAMFKPSAKAAWQGNLKQYRIGTSEAGDVRIIDGNGRAAVDPATGFFADGAVSVWSKPLVDGSDASLGGISAELNERDPASLPRRAFTHVGDATIPNGGLDLTADAQRLHEDNAAITAEALGLEASAADADARRATLLKWVRGLDVRDADNDDSTVDLRGFVGDPMHSRPIILNYKNGAASADAGTDAGRAQGEDGGEAADDPSLTSTVFVATNEGFLHAIDTKSGAERWAFMPGDLLENVNTLYVDDSGKGAHPYGLDGPLTIWSPDPEKDVTVDEANGEEAWLYAGMRRGGSNLYALDVSKRADPKLGWVIRGGRGDFAQLGQTWSQAKSARMMIDGTVRDVLVFGGGYDVANDEESSETDAVTGRATRKPDSVGRGVFIVDARTGERLWAGLGVREQDDGGTVSTIVRDGGSERDDGGPSRKRARHFPAMKYSFPGDVRVIDVNQDGLADQFYAADMGGQLWRFDVNQYHQSGEDLLDGGGVMADFGGDALADRRKFFYEPDVALIARDGERFLSISLGSGWRSHPLDDVIEDRFYMVRTDAIEQAPEDYGKKIGAGALAQWRPIQESDLVDVTNDVTPETNAYGWYIRMEDDGQKVLAESITVNNQIVFTAYRPEKTVDACSTAIGSSSVFVVDVLDGSPTIDLVGQEDAEGVDGPGAGDAKLDKKDRERVLTRGGIASEAAALITENGNIITVGPDQPLAEFDFGPLTQRTYWIDRNREAGASGVTLESIEQADADEADGSGGGRGADASGGAY